MRCIAGAGEAGSKAEIAGRAARIGLRIVTAIAHHNLGAGTIVGSEKNERVFKGTHRLQLRDDASDLLIHAIHHGRVDGHLGRLEVALLIREFSPGQGTIHLAWAEDFHRSGKA